MGLIEAAYARREATPPSRPIDYALMNRLYPKQKAALTRAMNAWRAAGSYPGWRDLRDATPEQQSVAERVAAVCRAAIVEWRQVGAWPDGWHTWNIALRDVTGLEMDDLR